MTLRKTNPEVMRKFIRRMDEIVQYKNEGQPPEMIVEVLEELIGDIDSSEAIDGGDAQLSILRTWATSTKAQMENAIKLHGEIRPARPGKYENGLLVNEVIHNWANETEAYSQSVGSVTEDGVWMGFIDNFNEHNADAHEILLASDRIKMVPSGAEWEYINKHEAIIVTELEGGSVHVAYYEDRVNALRDYNEEADKIESGYIDDDEEEYE